MGRNNQSPPPLYQKSMSFHITESIGNFKRYTEDITSIFTYPVNSWNCNEAHEKVLVLMEELLFFPLCGEMKKRRVKLLITKFILQSW